MTLQVLSHPTRRAASDIPAASVYDSDRWAAVVRDGFGLATQYLTVQDDQRDQACFPIVSRRQGPFRLAGSPLRGTHAEFGGAFAPGADQSMVMRALHGHLRAQRTSWMEWIFTHDQLTPHARTTLQALGYGTEQKHSLSIDLTQSSDAIWAGFAGRARTEVRKAGKNDLTVMPLGIADVPHYMQLVRDVFAGQQRKSSFDEQFLTAVHQHLLPSEFAHYGVFMDGRLVAGGLFFSGANRMVFVSGASDPVSRKLGANSLIQWHAMQEATAAGVTNYDMGGTGVGAIDKFKASFGGSAIQYDRFVYRTVTARIPAALYKYAHARGWV